MAFTCPRCGRASHGAEDERDGWCGACCAQTGLDTCWECAACGNGFWVPASHTGAVWCGCGSPERMLPAVVPAREVVIGVTRQALRVGEYVIELVTDLRLAPGQLQVRSCNAVSLYGLRDASLTVTAALTGDQADELARALAPGPIARAQRAMAAAEAEIEWVNAYEWSPGDPQL